jgi:hypothetical protein
MTLKLRFITIVVFLITLQNSAFAQSDYAVSSRGDTLRGELKILTSDPVDHLQIIVGNKKTNYTALQIKSIFHSGIDYRTVKYENSYLFMKLKKSGYLSLLQFREPGQQVMNGQFLSKSDGSGIEVPNLSFKKALAKYLSDCKDVSARIEKGDFGKRDLENIIDLYNACIQTKTESLAIKTQPIDIDSEKVLAVKNFTAKVEAESLVTKKDAVDVLKDIQSKVKKNEVIPNYLIEGLKSYLIDTPSLSKDLDSLIALLKK